VLAAPVFGVPLFSLVLAGATTSVFTSAAAA